MDDIYLKLKKKILRKIMYIFLDKFLKLVMIKVIYKLKIFKNRVRFNNRDIDIKNHRHSIILLYISSYVSPNFEENKMNIIINNNLKLYQS